MIVGLGNPGPQYSETRHNVGFMLIDRLAERSQTRVKREECKALIGRTFIGGQACELVKPLTFMNLSGQAVKCLMSKDGRSTARLLVISDDLAIPFEKLRLRRSGSHGGQNGLRSIISDLGTSEFARLRIGIGVDHPIGNTADFVLSRFANDEAKQLDDILDRAADAVENILIDGMDAAMARYN